MRRLQQKAMLVFNTNDFKDDSGNRNNPPSAINHLFVDVSHVGIPRTRYRRPSNFPPLKAPSKSKADLIPTKETTRKMIYENNGSSNVYKESTNKIQKKIGLSRSSSLVKPYVTHELQALNALDEGDEFGHENEHENASNDAFDQKLDSPTSENASQSSSEVSTFHTSNLKEDNSLKSTSLLYQVDRSALYPSNFKPFPHRNSHAKKKLLVGK